MTDERKEQIAALKEVINFIDEKSADLIVSYGNVLHGLLSSLQEHGGPDTVVKFIEDRIKEHERVQFEFHDASGGSVGYRQGRNAIQRKSEAMEILTFILNNRGEHSSGWIPCSERLPEPFAAVLVAGGVAIASTVKEGGGTLKEEQDEYDEKKKD